MALRAATGAALLEHGGPVLLFDEADACRYANAAARAALRLGRSAVGRPAGEVRALAIPELLDAIRRLRDNPRELELDLALPDRTTAFHARLVPIADGTAVFLRPLDRERDLEREVTRLRRELAVAGMAGATGSFAWDLRTGMVRVSEEALAIHGLDRSMGWVWQESAAKLVHPDDVAIQTEAVERAIANPGQPYFTSYRIVRADTGEIRRLRIAGELLPGTDAGPDLLVGSLTDITDQATARDALAESEERLRRTLEGVDAIISFQDHAASPVILNSAVRQILGYEPETINGFERWQSLVHPDDLEPCVAAWRGAGTWDLVYRMRRADGRWIWVADRGHWIDRGDEGHGMFSVVVDVTERVEAQISQVRAEARYRAVLEGADDAILIAGADGMVLACNRSIERLFGRRQEDVTGGSFRVLFPTADGDRIAAWAQDFLAGRVDRATGGVLELHGLRADGQTFPAELSLTAWTEGDEHYLAGMLRDISERKAAEAAARELQHRLAQAQRLEALGQLAGGVAHDMNNILAAIQGYASFAEAGIPVGSPAVDDLRQVLAAADRAGSLTRQLLAFSRQQRTEPVVVDLREVVDGIGPMLRRLLGEHIDVRIDHAASLGPIVADPGQIEQVVLNLAINARDAMPEGGILRIETSNLDGVLMLTRREPVDCVRLTVTDTGVGMDATIKARIFEPFFTTKPVGKGTGLGLATVYGIVEACGGTITVTSAPGLGTTFAVDFPRTTGTPETSAAEPATAARAENGQILLVEDDAAVREVTRRILSGLGFGCVACEDGRAALGVLAAMQFRPDVIVTDVRMPGIQGPDLVNRSRAFVPGLPAILLTGFDGDVGDQASELAATGAVEVLLKPTRAEALRAAVQRVRAA